MRCDAKLKVRSVWGIVVFHARPEAQKELLQLFAECTKCDVALNNVEKRSRTGHALSTHWPLGRNVKATAKKQSRPRGNVAASPKAKAKAKGKGKAKPSQKKKKK